jgi:hypothetical protein
MSENSEYHDEELSWSAAEEVVVEMVMCAVDRKVDLHARYLASDEDKVKRSAGAGTTRQRRSPSSQIPGLYQRLFERTPDLMRWRLEQTLGYLYKHTPRLTNVQGVPLYDMVFATDHPIGDKIMRSVYRDAGSGGLFTHEELIQDAPLATNETYEHTPPTTPFGQEA